MAQRPRARVALAKDPGPILDIHTVGHVVLKYSFCESRGGLGKHKAFPRPWRIGKEPRIYLAELVRAWGQSLGESCGF